MWEDAHEKWIMLKLGGVCAILGAIISVAAGIGFDNLTNAAGAETVLRTIASRARWYWPGVHLGFILGALLWVGALAALARFFSPGTSRVLGRLGLASIIIGAAIHIVDSSISGFALAALAEAWATTPTAQQPALLHDADLLLKVLGGTWWSVISYFHGLPFILFGLAVATSRDLPKWFGWVGALDGLGSLIVGLLMYLGVLALPKELFILFAVVISLWMAGIGILMWRRADEQRVT